MKRKICEVNIKGCLYSVFKIGVNNDYHGQCYPLKKKIEISDSLTKETIFHELMHVYFYECGMLKYYDDEDLITMLGRFGLELMNNYNKIFKIYKNFNKKLKTKKKKIM